MKKLIILAILIALSAAIAGCGGGSKTHWIYSDYNGSVRGVETAPPDNDTNVAVDTWIKVYWPYSYYAPPSRFSFTLEKETSGNTYKPVKTIEVVEDSDPYRGYWWFAPEHHLNYSTYYRITITDNSGKRYRSYFRTESGRSRAASAEPDKNYRPEGAENKSPTGTPADTHMIEVGGSGS